MSAHIHVSGLSHSCTDDMLCQAFIPFGKVVLAKVLRDECGHSLGLGIVRMARSADVAQIFDAHQRFEVLGSRVDLWEPAEPEGTQPDNLREISPTKPRQEKRQVKNQKALKPLMARKPGLTRNQAPSSRSINH